MKTLCIIIAVTVSFSLISPVSITLSTHSEEKLLVELNVCQPDGPVFSANGNVKGVCVDSCTLALPEICHTSCIEEPLCYVRFFPHEKDRPPEV